MAWLLKPRQASTDSRPAQPHTGQLLGAPPPTAAHGGPPAQSLLCTLASPSRREPTEILADLTGWNVWDLINEANVTVSGLRAVSWQGGMGCATAHISSSICRLAATTAESWLGERGRSSLPSNPTLRCSCSQLWQAACLVQGTPLHCCPGSRASPSGASTHSAPLLPPAQAAYLVQGINSSIATLPSNLEMLSDDIEAVAANVRQARAQSPKLGAVGPRNLHHKPEPGG